MADREEISRGLAEGLDLKDVAEAIGRDPSVVSREVRRHGGRAGYRAGRADTTAASDRRRPAVRKIDAVPGLREHVSTLLKGGWSPASIAGRLPIEHAGNEAWRVSHQAIYQWVYAQPVGQLRTALIELRTGRVRRRPQGSGRLPAPRIKNPQWIEDRPAEPAVPGHWEGDLVIGKTAVATLVERTTRFLMVVPLTGRDSLTVGEAIIASYGDLPPQLKRSLTWDCDTEMAAHALVAKQIPVYFEHPAPTPTRRGNGPRTSTQIGSCASTSRRER